jgi:hypothetical protein
LWIRRKKRNKEKIPTIRDKIKKKQKKKKKKKKERNKLDAERKGKKNVYISCWREVLLFPACLSSYHGCLGNSFKMMKLHLFIKLHRGA